MELAKALGKVLLYLQGEEHSSFLHDRAWILWDLNKEVPHSIEVRFNGISIWQPVIFKNLPFTCFRCNKSGHIARDCQDELDLSKIEEQEQGARNAVLHQGVGYPPPQAQAQPQQSQQAYWNDQPQGMGHTEETTHHIYPSAEAPPLHKGQVQTEEIGAVDQEAIHRAPTREESPHNAPEEDIDASQAKTPTTPAEGI
jgi:hypothetical protein